MKIKTENKSSQTALRCTRMLLQQILLGVRSITLEGALNRTAEDGRERRTRGLERSCLLCANLCSIAHRLRSIAVTETGTCGAERELEKRD